MISSKDKHTIADIAKRYNVSKVYLFGSNITLTKEANDIDLAVEGLPDSLYFKFYGDLIFALSKPVDLVDMKKKSMFTDMIKKEGIILYG